MRVAIALLILLLVGPAIRPDQAHAATVTGIVKRPPASPGQPPTVNRYRGREAAAASNHEEKSSSCTCEPWRFAVIHLDGDSLPAPVLPTTPPSMAQKGQMFVPSVMAVAVGTTVSFPNLDPFFHNVFSYSKPKRFDLGKYPKGETEMVTFDKPGLVSVFCEIHYSMRAYVHVFATPYFTVANDKGEFTLENVRPGTYKMTVWQENQPDLTQMITVTGDTLKVEVE